MMTARPKPASLLLLFFLFSSAFMLLGRTLAFRPTPCITTFHRNDHNAVYSCGGTLSSHHQRTTTGTVATKLFSRRRRKGEYLDDDDNNSSNVVIDFIDRFASLASQPTPGTNNLALGFPVILLLQATIVPLLQTVLSIVLFGTLRTVARQLVIFEETSGEDVYGIDTKKEETEEEKILSSQIDFVVLVLSVFSAGLLTPRPDDDAAADALMSIPLTALVALVLLGLAAVLLQENVAKVEREEQLSKDDKLLNRWDERFRDDDDKSDQSRSNDE